MKFPTLVYKCPGKHQCGNKGTFNYKGVDDEKELCDQVKNGWYPTLPFAQDPEGFNIDKYLKDYVEEVKAVNHINDYDKQDNESHDEELNREELEKLANGMGLKFRGTIGDKKLKEKIEDAIKG